MVGPVGYSTTFIRGVLSLWILLASGALLIGAANELFSLGLFDDGYPVVWADPASRPGFAGFGLQCAAVIAVATGLSAVAERLNGGQ